MVWTSKDGPKCPVSREDRGEFMKPHTNLEDIAGMDLLALAAGLEDNLCHRYCECPRHDGVKDCIQTRAAKVLRAAQEKSR